MNVEEKAGHLQTLITSAFSSPAAPIREDPAIGLASAVYPCLTVCRIEGINKHLQVRLFDNSHLIHPVQQRKQEPLFLDISCTRLRFMVAPTAGGSKL
jgi:hypothetical protein